VHEHFVDKERELHSAIIPPMRTNTSDARNYFARRRARSEQTQRF
jgi:hypothetical protein